MSRDKLRDFGEVSRQHNAPSRPDHISAESWPFVNERRDFCHLINGLGRLEAPGAPVAQAVGAQLVERLNAIPQGLPFHAADARGVGAAYAVQQRRQRMSPVGTCSPEWFSKPLKTGTVQLLQFLASGRSF